MNKNTLIAILLVAVISIGIKAAQAQLPLPPPFPLNSNENKAEYIAPNDHSPPVIHILTQSLFQGKNVIVFQAQDNSSIHSIKFEVDQANQTTYLSPVRADQQGSYKVLVDAHSPSLNIKITASDAAGNTGIASKKYAVSDKDEVSTYLSSLVVWFEKLLSGVLRV